MSSMMQLTHPPWTMIGSMKLHEKHARQRKPYDVKEENVLPSPLTLPTMLPLNRRRIIQSYHPLSRICLTVQCPNFLSHRRVT